MLMIGCCCGTSCTIASDDFAVDDLATNWDVRSGTPTISGGVLNASAGTNLVIHNTAAGGAATGVYSSVIVRVTSTSDIVRLIIAYTDDNNYWFAEAQAGAFNGTLKLFQRSGGSNTQKGTTATVFGFQINENWLLKLCAAPGSVIAMMWFSGAPIATALFAGTATVASTKAGVGGSETGTVTFDDFAFENHRVDDSSCQACYACSTCSAGYLPVQFQVDLAGFTNDACTDCANLNGTFVCDNGGLCRAFGPSPLICGGGVQIQVAVAFDSFAGTWLVDVAISNIIQFRLSGITPIPDCQSFNNLSIPLLVANSSCNASVATCNVTSL